MRQRGRFAGFWDLWSLPCRLSGPLPRCLVSRAGEAASCLLIRVTGWMDADCDERTDLAKTTRRGLKTAPGR